MLHYKSDVVEPEGVAEAAVEGFAAACDEMEDQVGRLCAWLCPAFFLDDPVLALAVDVVVGGRRISLETHIFFV